MAHPNIREGTTRIVNLYPHVGIVLKEPHPVWTPRPRRPGSSKIVIPFDDGVKMNLAEAEFFEANRHPFCMPVIWCKEGGELLAQELGQPLDVNDEDFVWQMYNLTHGEMKEEGGDNHVFRNPENFVFDKNGRLRIVDFSEANVQRLIIKFGEEIMNSFNPRFSWIEEIGRARGWSPEKMDAMKKNHRYKKN